MAKGTGTKGKEMVETKIPSSSPPEDKVEIIVKAALRNITESVSAHVTPNVSGPVPAGSVTEVGDRLQHRWTRWREIGTSLYVLRIIRWGLKLLFLKKPILSSVPIFMDSYQNNIVKRAALWQALQELLQKRVLEEVENPHTPGFYGRLFIRPKPNGKWRTIIDLSDLNEFISCPPFQMETVKKVQSSMRKGMKSIKIDLSDAYFHVLMHPNYRKYMRVALFGKVYQFRAMPMGLNISARIFTKVCLEVVRYVRSKGIHIHAYLDDWKIKGYDQTLVAAQGQYLVDLCKHLGWLVNIDKSMLTPSQDYQYVGIHFRLDLGLALVPTDRLESLEKMIRELLRRGGGTARTWSSIIGKMGSMIELVKMAALHRRPLQWIVQNSWDQSRDSWEKFIELQEWLVPHLEWWLDRGNTARGVPLEPFQPKLSLYTDASQWGYGATLGNRSLSGQWSKEEAGLHSNNREMLATLRAVEHFQDVIRNSSLLICSDNTTTVATINKQGGTKSWSMTEMAWNLWNKLDALNCVTKARHIPGSLNVRADAMSRMQQVISTEWSIAPEALIPVWEQWGIPMVDLFATCQNHKLERYVSPVPDPGAWAINAMTFSWTGLFVYAFPPWKIIGEALMKLEEDQAEMILVAPYWPTRAWYPLLLDLLIAPPIQLSQKEDLLSQSHSGKLFKDLKMLNLHAFRLSGRVQRQ